MLRWARAPQEEARREAARGKSVDTSSAGQGLEGCYAHCQTAGAITCLCFSPCPLRKGFAKRQACRVRVCLWELGAESGPVIFALDRTSCRCFPMRDATRAGQGRWDGQLPGREPCPALCSWEGMGQMATARSKKDMRLTKDHLKSGSSAAALSGAGI